MKNLTDVYDQIAAQDVVLEKQAAELIKQAEEEDAAGRIMARGFADELNKLAGYDGGAGAFDTGPKGGATKKPSGGIIPAGGYQTGGGKTGGGYNPFAGKSRSATNQTAAAQAGGGSKNTIGAPPAKFSGGPRAGGLKTPAAPKPTAQASTGAPKFPGA